MKGFLTYMWVGGAILYTLNMLAYSQLVGPEAERPPIKSAGLEDKAPRTVSSWGSYLEPKATTGSVPSSVLKAPVESLVKPDAVVGAATFPALSAKPSHVGVEETPPGAVSAPPFSAISGIGPSVVEVESAMPQPPVSVPPPFAATDMQPASIAAEDLSQEVAAIDFPSLPIGTVPPRINLQPVEVAEAGVVKEIAPKQAHAEPRGETSLEKSKKPQSNRLSQVAVAERALKGAKKTYTPRQGLFRFGPAGF